MSLSSLDPLVVGNIVVASDLATTESKRAAGLRVWRSTSDSACWVRAGGNNLQVAEHSSMNDVLSHTFFGEGDIILT